MPIPKRKYATDQDDEKTREHIFCQVHQEPILSLQTLLKTDSEDTLLLKCQKNLNQVP